MSLHLGLYAKTFDVESITQNMDVGAYTKVAGDYD